MADGGEGTASCFDGTPITLPTTDAAGRLTEATYMFNDGDVAEAYIDVAAASGLPAVADHPVPLTGDTYGTGVLIADAVTRGAQRIILGLGGTATVDGGTGILVALGATPQDKAGHPLRPGGGSLTELAGFDTAQLNIPAAAVEWVLLTDVTNPATGPDGAAAVFGPQKGATPEDITLLDAALAQLCDTLRGGPHHPRLRCRWWAAHRNNVAVHTYAWQSFPHSCAARRAHGRRIGGPPRADPLRRPGGHG